jgi:hypothetical protein
LFFSYQSSQYSAKPEKFGFSPNFFTENSFKQREHPRIELCAMNPATFLAAGMSQETRKSNPNKKARQIFAK